MVIGQEHSGEAAFIVGTGRCGSTLLSKLLARHPAVLSLSEVFSSLDPAAALEDGRVDGPKLWKLLSEPRVEVSDLLALAALPEITARRGDVEIGRLAPLMLVTLPFLSAEPEMLLAEIGDMVCRLPEQGVCTAYETLFGWLRARLGRTIWVERSGGSLAYVDRILRLWPHARVVHLWRAGVNCALSMSRHAYFRVAVARACARNPALDVTSALAAEIPLDRFGAYWSRTIMFGLSVLAHHTPDRVLTVRYESLLDEPAQELSMLARFLGLESSEEWISSCLPEIRRPAPAFRVGSESSQKSLERICLPGERALLKWRHPER